MSSVGVLSEREQEEPRFKRARPTSKLPMAHPGASRRQSGRRGRRSRELGLGCPWSCPPFVVLSNHWSKEGGCSLPARGRRTRLLHLARGSPSWRSDRATSGRHLPPTWTKWPDTLIGLSRLLKLITAEGIVWPCLAGMGMLSAFSEFTSCKSG